MKPLLPRSARRSLTFPSAAHRKRSKNDGQQENRRAARPLKPAGVPWCPRNGDPPSGRPNVSTPKSPRAAAKIGFPLLVKSGCRVRPARGKCATVPTDPATSRRRQCPRRPARKRCGHFGERGGLFSSARSWGRGRGTSSAACSAISTANVAGRLSTRVVRFSAAIQKLVEERRRSPSRRRCAAGDDPRPPPPVPAKVGR